MENDRTASYEMRKYIGTKTVQARRMDAADAKRAGANVPGKYFEVGHAEYNPGADGYLVIYDGGYRSWSPAKTFEGAYRVAETDLDRMKIELDELNERLCKATSDLYKKESSLQANPACEPLWGSLREQVNIMLAYADILTTRIRQLVGYEIRISKERNEYGTVD